MSMASLCVNTLGHGKRYRHLGRAHKLNVKRGTEIKTEKCRIHTLAEVDAPDVLRLVQNAESRQFLGGPVDSAAFPNRFHAMLNDEATHHWVVRLTGEGQFAGLLSLGPHHDGRDQEVSYQFLPEFWGRGLASESLRALLGEAWKRFGLENVIAETQTANTRSIRLLESLGFLREQILIRFDAEQAVYRKRLP
jgi:ribosomal-protein-alanine N-acetyltransferase